MLLPIRDFPIKTFEGYKLVAFRQGRSNIAAKILREPVLHFLPFRGTAGLFLPANYPLMSEAMIRAEWNLQGAPAVRLPGKNEFVLFDKCYPIDIVPFAGYDDFWVEGDRATLLCKRALDATRLEGQIESLRRAQLLQRAQETLAAWTPKLTRHPASIQIAPLRPRILGNCSQDGEIKLNRSLATLPLATMEEVLAHELVHLIHFNHSPLFWQELSRLLPDWLPRTLIHYLQ